MHVPIVIRLTILAFLSISLIGYSQRPNSTLNPTDTSCHWLEKNYTGPFPKIIHPRTSGWVQDNAFSDDFDLPLLNENK
jgi:hypothetical protein